MSMLHATTPYRRSEHGPPQVPVVVPVVEVRVDDQGCLDIQVDRKPYPVEGRPHRGDLSRVLDEHHHRPGNTGAHPHPRARRDNLHRLRHAVGFPGPPTGHGGRVDPRRTRRAGQIAGRGFAPAEDVAVAVIVARQVASTDGSARIRLPPALLAAHPGLVVLIGQTSGTVIVSGNPR